jgi:FKBP-type peptidyl-prolyl cis-trans isomerase FkpA
MRWLLPLLAMLVITACSVSPQAHAQGDVQKLIVIDTKVGTGKVATNGKDVVVHYTGWLYDQNAKDHHGSKFDSSLDTGTPLTFTLGEGKVIEGWDQGVAGMRVGGKRTLLIPASLGYGDSGAGDAIPPGASLVFDVELLNVTP